MRQLCAPSGKGKRRSLSRHDNPFRQRSKDDGCLLGVSCGNEVAESVARGTRKPLIICKLHLKCENLMKRFPLNREVVFGAGLMDS